MKTFIALGLVAIATVVSAQRPGAPPAQKPEQMMGDELYAAYLKAEPEVLVRAFPPGLRFEYFRKDFRERVLTKWEALERQPSRAMFMLDISLANHQGNFIYWADYLVLAQTYLRQRSELPGVNPAFDEFEIQWNKTAVAFLAGRRQPDLVEEFVKRLRWRIVAEPAADGAGALVDPWIELARGFVEEGYGLEDPARWPTRGQAALERYREAAKYESLRAEATVRSAFVQLQLARPADALATLDTFDERWTREGVVVYWARLIRGKVLDALDRPDDAIAAYRRALEIAASAQSPHVGMMMVEGRRNQAEAAERHAQTVRSAPDPVIDPWWIYAHGDLRFYQDRLKTLRAMVKK